MSEYCSRLPIQGNLVLGFSREIFQLLIFCTAIGNLVHSLNQDRDTMLGVRVFDTRRM